MKRKRHRAPARLACCSIFLSGPTAPSPPLPSCAGRSAARSMPAQTAATSAVQKDPAVRNQRETVDGWFWCAYAAAAVHVRPRVHLRPEALDLQRVLAEQHLLDAEADDVRAEGVDALAHDPGVGVALAHPDDRAPILRGRGDRHDCASERSGVRACGSRQAARVPSWQAEAGTDARNSSCELDMASGLTSGTRSTCVSMFVIFSVSGIAAAAALMRSRAGPTVANCGGTAAG